MIRDRHAAIVRARLGLAVVLIAASSVVAASCGNQNATPAPTGAASASPGASGSTGPKPSPSADPASAAIERFVERVTAASFDYQATFTGRSRHTTDIIPISKGLLQVSGDDVLVRLTFTAPGGVRLPVEHRYVGGKGWIQYPSSRWERIPVKPAETMAAFVRVHTTADVTYLKKVTSGGKTLFQVQIRSAIVDPVMIPASNLTDTAVTSPKLTLLIDTAGRPVRGTAEIRGKGRVSGQLQEIVIDLTVTFVKVGQNVTVKAP